MYKENAEKDKAVTERGLMMAISWFYGDIAPSVLGSAL